MALLPAYQSGGARNNRSTGPGILPAYNTTGQSSTPTISEQKQQRLEQGLPVSTRADRAEPTFVGNIIRGTINPIATLLARPVQLGMALGGMTPEQQTIHSSYLGDIKTSTSGKDVVKDIGRGLETVSLGLGGEELGTSVKALGKIPFKEIAGKLSAEGAAIGALGGAGYGIEQGKKPTDVAEEAISGGVVGAGLNLIGGGLINRFKKVLPEDLAIITRHGETPLDAQGKAGGIESSKLDKSGIKKAGKIGELYKQNDVKYIVTSKMPRATETADIVAKKSGAKIISNEKLNPWDIGELTGKPDSEVKPILEDYIKNKPDEKLPGGESFNDFRKRVHDGIEEVKSETTDGRTGIIVHGGVGQLLRSNFASDVESYLGKELKHGDSGVVAFARPEPVGEIRDIPQEPRRDFSRVTTEQSKIHPDEEVIKEKTTNIPEFESMRGRREELIANSNSIIDNDRERAFRIALGIEDAPAGTRPDAIHALLSNRKDLTVEETRMLANSKVPSESGARLEANKLRVASTPVDILRDMRSRLIEKAKKANITKNTVKRVIDSLSCPE